MMGIIRSHEKILLLYFILLVFTFHIILVPDIKYGKFHDLNLAVTKKNYNITLENEKLSTNFPTIHFLTHSFDEVNQWNLFKVSLLSLLMKIIFKVK